MHRRFLAAAAFALSVASAVPAFAAGNEAEYKAALASAETAIQQAAALKNQWSTTLQALAAAKKDAGAGDFDKATALARHAEDLAKASIAQAKEQATAWKDAVVR